ncbi:RNI-like protein [Setomelanomma holmii]|uniref:RNI-like protein n=1 Tax=Setomelanomma holmii TaxID=210430 RepID=A0A9P4LLM6_9PLEO|nr:RNI-like protein [Setomelanomma holmii]
MTAVQAPHDTAAAMEDIHGVDVSWLHHSTRDHHHRQQAPSSPGLTRDAPPKTSSHGGLPSRPHTEERKNNVQSTVNPATAPAPAVQQPASQPPQSTATTLPQKIPSKRPALLSRGSADKPGSFTSPDPKGSLRRNSWISSISSKFSSQNPPAQMSQAQAQGSPAATNGANGTAPSANGALNGIHAASAGGQHGLEPYVPQQPKASFLSNALRRLSSGTQVGTTGKVYPSGGVCPRRVMNVDPNRARCLVPELDQNKLRKVAFCVDVEIAGGPRYKDDVDSEGKKKKRKDKKLKERGEGEALKHPNAVAEEKDNEGIVAATQENVGTESDPNPEGTMLEDDKKENSKKKEKKKRSEAERKERKEKKRRKAEENGSIPIEFTRDDDEGSVEGATAISGATTPKSQDRPTVDPLRIYRRCCQLRESPILKRISDQLSNPASCSLAQSGVVTSLDLTGSRLQLADVMTLSDWLAIVPVKKLFLEDADLNDEKIRVILAGLLAAKVPEGPKKRPTVQEKIGDDQQGGVIKKLVLKNNPKITSEGWKHIALFIYLCKSIIALDVSMIPFPRFRPQMSPPPTDTPQVISSTHESRSRDVGEILSKAIAERLGGAGLQELSMGECSLTAAAIRKIIDGCVVSGLQRLGLATNDIDGEGLEHVLHYIRSGVCQGIDLGGNELKEWIPRLCDGLRKENPIWALCLADTGLTPESLKTLFPTLVAIPSFKFLDLSHNKGLFSNQYTLWLIRKYMPMFRELKRIHLMDVDLKPEDAIAIAEILPDCPHIAHINILENPAIIRVATNTDAETQEEAAALYASLTLAAKLSTSLVAVDVDVPASEMGEVVKALAKQVVAYCLRNIESLNEVPELNAPPRQVEMPHVLMHLVGQDDTYCNAADTGPPAPDDDYIVGGTGIAKALSYCLSHKATDLRRVSVTPSGTTTPRSRVEDPEEPSKARTMSKNLLETARNTRARIQPALIREAKAGNGLGYRTYLNLCLAERLLTNARTGRLLFLDETLRGMIQRFEDEYPETRLQPSDNASTHSSVASVPSSSPPVSAVPTLDNSITDITGQDSDEEEPPMLRSRHNSDVSLASRHMSQEEGRLHRFGHRVRTGLLNPSRPTSSHGDSDETNPAFLSGSMDDHGLPEHLRSLRMYFQNMSGDEMRQMIEGVGWEKAFDSVVANAEELRNLEREDPAAFKVFRESQIAALKNRNPDILGPGEAHERKSGDDFAVED